MPVTGLSLVEYLVAIVQGHALVQVPTPIRDLSHCGEPLEQAYANPYP